jgi:uncharacterized protein (TIGR03437 family)
MKMDRVVLLVKRSAAQQTELDQLLADQQNPSSPQFHRWLTPEEFGNRFGLSTDDLSKVAAWLSSEGFTIQETARGRNWIAFGGNAGQVSKSLHVPIHRMEVEGRTHFANTADPSVPDALSGVVEGFLGLDDFRPKPYAVRAAPNYTIGPNHYMAPEDFGTIYNVAPLYQSGLDGTGQSIAVVGQSAVMLSDIRTFRTRFNLPANDPKIMLYGTTDPGYTDAQIEGNLDLEWAGAIAPKATIYYVYGPSAFAAMVAVVNANLAPVISVSYGGCESGYRPSYYRSIAQQANAQGITIVAASGDSGAAGCDPQGAEPFAAQGRMVALPSALPEVTGIGGTQFADAGGTYWAARNSANYGSALSYIPETAWNESDATGLGSTGGGASQYYPQPVWQTGPAVPADGARHVPDLALNSALHTPYYVTYYGGGVAVGGTSAAAPSMAGILALLNQYRAVNGLATQLGLGNINPQLYRLAQSAPAAFHDVTSGDNIVPCSQGSPDCLTGSYGYVAGAGYDMTTGLGSVDAYNLVTQWNTSTNTPAVNLIVSAAKATVNDTIAATALVSAASGAGTPTGTVAFSANGVPLGTASLVARDGQQAADVFFPVYLLGTGTFNLAATYSGDAAFSSGGATTTLKITVPTGAAAIIPSAPNTVWPSPPPDAQGAAWQTALVLREAAGIPALITGFTIDGQAQPLAQYFPSQQIPAGGSVTATVVFRNLETPLTKTFGFTGTDAAGNAWSRQVPVAYLPLPPSSDFSLSATPLTIAQDTSADSSCQWSAQVNIDNLSGYPDTVAALAAGSLDISDRIPAIFGTARLAPWSSLQGTVCFGGITPPASNLIAVVMASGVWQQVTVSFAGPPATPVKITAEPVRVALAAAAEPSATAQATLALDLSDKTQPWTVSVFPANRATSWLRVSPLSGTGPAQLALTASGAGFEPGVYGATITIQSPNAVPPSRTIPVMFVLGGSSSGTVISSVESRADNAQSTASPGALVAVSGSNLAGATASASSNPLSYSTGGVSATVNGIAAPLLYVSSNQVQLQVPYEVGAGPAVLGINNNGQIAGFPIQIAPAAPAVFADANGGLSPNATVKAGSATSLYVTGAGEVSPMLPTGWSPTSSSDIPQPVLPLSVTVGGVPAFLEYVGNSRGLVGTIQVNFKVPASVPAGPQPVVVTVNGVSSRPVTVTVE